MKPTIILTIGASCSGKSTWAQEAWEFYRYNTEEHWVVLERDTYRFDMFTNGKRDWTKYKFNKKNERAVTEAIDKDALEAVGRGDSIIISDTNLNPAIRQKWKDFAQEHGYEYEEKLFPCDWNTLVKRNAQREGGLSESLLWSQYKRYMQQFGKIGEHPVKPYQHNPMLESTIICDIDGTIADMTGVRKPFEWDKVGLDNPRIEIIRMLEGLAYVHGHVTFMSGRDGCCYDGTYQWLEEHVTSDWPEYIEWQLLMRTPDDKRKDDVVKYELYQQWVKGKYNVAAVLDDRPQMIRAWSVLDMPNIINVGEYNNEF